MARDIEAEYTAANEAAYELVRKYNPPHHVISGMTSRWPKGNWPVTLAGQKPTFEQLAIAAAFCKATAGAEGGAHSLMLRPEGMNSRQLSVAYNCKPANNHAVIISGGTRNGVKGMPWFTRVKLGVDTYRMVITKLGLKKLETVLTLWAAGNAAAGEVDPPVKGKANGKSKPKAKKARKASKALTQALDAVQGTDSPVTVEPTSEAPPVTEATLPELGVTEAPVTE